MRPNFMIIGTAKSATTTLAYQFRQHPEIFVPARKELDYFSKDFHRGLAWYEAFFDDAGSRPMRGEASHSYTTRELYPEAAARIAAYDPDRRLKLIYIVRDPLARIESYWIQLRKSLGEAVHYDFNTAVRVNRHLLLDSSNYRQQLEVYRRLYPDNQILVLFFEDLRADQAAVLRRCFEFLGVDLDTHPYDPSVRDESTAGARAPTALLSKLRQYPAYRRAARLIPEAVRNPIRNSLLYKTHRERPRWDPATRAWALEVIGDDCRQFLRDHGKPDDFWDLDG